MLFYFNRGNTFCIKHFCTICYFLTIASHHYDVIEWRHQVVFTNGKLRCEIRFVKILFQVFHSLIVFVTKIFHHCFAIDLNFVEQFFVDFWSPFVHCNFWISLKDTFSFGAINSAWTVQGFPGRDRPRPRSYSRTAVTWTSNWTGTRMSENGGFTRTSILRGRRRRA